MAAATAVLDAHVPRLAAEWPADGSRWRELDATLVFADVSGFTALSERLARRGTAGAEELTEVLGRAFADLLGVAYAFGGTLVKFGGDALLLLFDGDGHAGRGVDAAAGMRATTRRVGSFTASVGRVRLRMSVGVHTGAVHAFRAGRSHAEVLLVGPGPSTVVEMEGVAGAGEVVVSPATAARLDPSRLGATKGGGVLLRDRAVDLSAPVGAFPVRAHRGDLSPLVPLALRRHLLDGGGESEHRSAAIAFLHFDGTDALLAAHGPAWMAAALDELVEGVQAAVDREGATFLASDLDHDGGKLILVAGVPRTLGDDDGRLLRAVHEIVTTPRRLPVRVGVHRGPVFAGEVGPPYRRTFTIMGDAVNLTARLMAKAAPGQVLATAAVLERSRTAFATTELAPFTVKGKARPVHAFAVGAARGTQETRRSARLPLVGREAEVGTLRDAVAAAVAGAGAALVLEGDVGVGKTRLLEETRSAAAGAGAVMRVVQCEQYESSTPFFAARVLLTSVLGGVDELARRVGVVAPDLLPWLPLLGDVLDVAVPETRETRDLEARYRRARTERVVIDLLTAVLPGPAVLAFDDSHWIDDGSASTVAALAAAAPDRAWLVLLARRPEPGADGDAVAMARRIDVGPLADADVHALVAAATEEAPLPPERRAAIVERAAGNALFAEELLALAGSEGDELPATIEAVVGLQLDRLPTPDARLLRVASVLGVSFDAGLLAAVVAGDDTVDPTDATERLAGFLVREADGRLRFRHRLLRDVAYGLLPHRRRRELHGRAAIAIEQAAGGSPGSRAEVLSLHHLHAQRYDDCLRYATAAALQARRAYALVEAAALYERALVAARRLDPPASRPTVCGLWMQLAKVRQLRGDFAGADAAYTAAARLRPDSPVHVARVALRRAEIAERQGRHVAEARWVGRGLRALAGRDGPAVAAERAHLLNHHAFLRYQLGHPRDALRWARRAAAEAERAGSRGRAALANAYTVMDSAHLALGRPDRAVNGEKALAIYRRLRARANIAALQNNLGAFAYYRGDWAGALQRYEESRANFERIGNLVDAALGRANIAEIFADQGRLTEAEDVLVDVIATWRSLSFPLGLARAVRYLGRVQLRRGAVEAALASFDEARATFLAAGLVANVHEVDVWRAECLLRQGGTEAAKALLEAALAHEVSSGATDMRAMIHRLRAAAAMAGGDLEGAWAEIDESLHVARSRGAAYDVALALEFLATLARLGGRPLDESARRERDELFQLLGVVAPPAPPIVIGA